MNALQYINKLSTSEKNKVSKLTVRELEEETKNIFIAFVDEGTHSFDVKIELNKEEVLHAFCDCTLKEAFCLHKTAVLAHIFQNKTSVTTKRQPKKKIVKLTEAQQILQELSVNQLTEWLSLVFSANKEIELQFLMQFSKKTLSYEIEDIEKLVANSFISVMVKRKKIELNELKKILEILTKVLSPVFDFIQTQITHKKAFDLFTGILNSLVNQELKYTVPGTRFPKYINSVIEKFALILNQVQDNDAWEQQITELVDAFFNSEFQTDNYSINILKHTHTLANSAQKKYISKCVTKNLIESIEEDFNLRIEFNEILLDIVIENNDFETVSAYFTTYPYQNAYNIKFLNALKNSNPELTIDYCKNCILRNTKVDYNLPYLLILEELLTQQNNYSELAKVKLNKFVLEPNFDDYKFIMLHLEDKNYLPKFRVNTLSRLRNLFYKQENHSDIYFEILNDEKNYKKMQEVIKQDLIPLAVLNKYLDVLFTQDSVGLLQSVAKNLILSDMDDIMDDDFSQTHDFVTSNYSKKLIVTIVEDFWEKFYYYYPESTKSNLLKKFTL